jgi:dTDP-4-dehydrorhamnose reductase
VAAGITVTETPIPGVLLLDLPLHGDNRGWFKENWQREKMVAAGLPDFGPVQNNISFNHAVGTTRGIHAEPWDKFISVATGRVFGAWVDLREGDNFGRVFTTELDPSRAIFVPRGVGNAYQTLEPSTAYTYLVNEHWSADVSYTFLNLADERAAIHWPIPLDQAELSDKDRHHPRMADVVPVPARRTLVVGGSGQLGRALRHLLPDAIFAGREDIDLSEPTTFGRVNWRDTDTVINAAAYTRVDDAETKEGRRTAWATNVQGVAALARHCAENQITLVHVSSDYVFDGTKAVHQEDEPFSPLGVYGQTKAAGDAIIASVPRHYIVRTSWVVGEGANFVRTMAALADRGVAPSVVGDQFGRLTFAEDLALGILHLVRSRAPYGTYNLSNTGDAQSWADIAKAVFRLRGKNPDDVTSITTEEYFAGKQVAPRPRNSVLDLSRLEETGFRPAAAADRLGEYVARLP